MPNLYVGENGPVVIPRPPPSPKQNPGPPARGSYTGQRSTGGSGAPGPPPKPPPDMFSAYTGPAVSAASQMVQQFLTLLGYPTGLDANQLALQLLQHNLLADPVGASQFLFYSGTGMTDTLRQSHQWAQFGLDAQTYQTRVDSMDTLFQQVIGKDPQQFAATGGDAIHQLYFDALKNNWSQSTILQKLQTDASFADLRAAQPWLATGQGEQQAQQQFSSLYGSAPVSQDALAGWFRFNQGSQQLNRTAREAITVAAPQPGATTSR